MISIDLRGFYYLRLLPYWVRLKTQITIFHHVKKYHPQIKSPSQ